MFIVSNRDLLFLDSIEVIYLKKANDHKKYNFDIVRQ